MGTRSAWLLVVGYGGEFRVREERLPVFGLPILVEAGDSNSPPNFQDGAPQFFGFRRLHPHLDDQSARSAFPGPNG